MHFSLCSSYMVWYLVWYSLSRIRYAKCVEKLNRHHSVLFFGWSQRNTTHFWCILTTYRTFFLLIMRRKQAVDSINNSLLYQFVHFYAFNERARAHRRIKGEKRQQNNEITVVIYYSHLCCVCRVFVLLPLPLRVQHGVYAYCEDKAICLIDAHEED